MVATRPTTNSNGYCNDGGQRNACETTETPPGPPLDSSGANDESGAATARQKRYANRHDKTRQQQRQTRQQQRQTTTRKSI